MNQTSIKRIRGILERLDFTKATKIEKREIHNGNMIGGEGDFYEETVFFLVKFDDVEIEFRDYFSGGGKPSYYIASVNGLEFHLGVDEKMIERINDAYKEIQERLGMKEVLNAFEKIEKNFC